jgi:MFS family permease
MWLFMRQDASVKPEMSWWRLLTREHWLVFLAASLAWMFDCFDQQIFNLARDGAMEDLLPSAQLAKEYGPYTTSVLLIAWAIGGLLFGALGDRHGRVRMLTVCILLYALGSGLSSLSTGMLDFCVYRFISGLGIGGVFGLVVALLADSLPDRARAPALGWLQSLSTWGNLAAASIGMLLGALAARNALPWGIMHWRAMFVAGALPAVLAILFARLIREPRGWVAARVEGSRRGIEFGSYRRLLGDPRWSKHAWLGLVACSAGIIGLWGVGNFHPTIVGALVEQHFAAAGLSAGELANEKAYWRSVGLLLQNIGGFCGMLSLAMLAQKRGRRFACALSLSLSFLTTVLVFQFLRDLDQMYWMLPLMGFGQLSVLGVYVVYLPELFPTSLRSTGTSFCYNVGRIVAATAPFTLSQLTKRLGGDIEGFRTAGTAVSFVLLLGLVVLPFLPETKGQPLPVD